MLNITIADLLTKDWNELDPTDEPYCIYPVKDADAILYIGSSNSPLERLMQHFDQRSYFTSGSALGWFYLEHRDLSVNWTIELLTRDEW